MDLLFLYTPERTQNAETSFRILVEKDIDIVEPDLFRIEMTGQITRRLGKKSSKVITQRFFKKIKFIDTSVLFDTSLSIALETGSRAIDAFYIGLAKREGIPLISNDKFQIGTQEN